MTKLFALILAFSLAIGAAYAQGEGPPEKPKDDAKGDDLPIPEPQTFTASASGKFNGEQVRYIATAAERQLRNEKDEPIASVFSIAYVKDGVSDPATRPITFVFNGGPGSASLWLHMGLLGPKRIAVPSDGTPAGPPPYTLEPNPLSVLDVTDLVFIDPVGTGYSRAVGKGQNKDFWGTKEDAKYLAEFIRLYVTDTKRWNSPRYIVGESYGTTRAAALAKELQDGYTGLAPNGIVLISAILDFQGVSFRPGDNEAYIGYLPTFAAVARFHNKIKDTGEDLPAFIDKVRDFAIHDYAPALLEGSRLSEAETRDIVQKLAAFTGLSETYIERAKLRVSAQRFEKELLRDEGKIIGRYDGRYTGTDYDDAGEVTSSDPSSDDIDAAFVSAINDYLARELGVTITREYQVLPTAVGRGWNWAVEPPGAPPTDVNVAPSLGEAMRENKGLRIFVANGYYDLATPFFSTENTLANNGIDPKRVTMDYFEAGHMMYLHKPSLEKLAADIRAFIKNAPPAAPQ